MYIDYHFCASMHYFIWPPIPICDSQRRLSFSMHSYTPSYIESFYINLYPKKQPVSAFFQKNRVCYTTHNVCYTIHIQEHRIYAYALKYRGIWLPIRILISPYLHTSHYPICICHITLSAYITIHTLAYRRVVVHDLSWGDIRVSLEEIYKKRVGIVH